MLLMLLMSWCTDATDALMLLKRWCYWCADVLLRWCCWCCWCADVLMQLMCWCTGSALVWNVLVSLDLSVHPCFKQQTVSWWFSQDFLWPPINFLQHFLSSTASPTKYSHQTCERISFYSYKCYLPLSKSGDTNEICLFSLIVYVHLPTQLIIWSAELAERKHRREIGSVKKCSPTLSVHQLNKLLEITEPASLSGFVFAAVSMAAWWWKRFPHSAPAQN